jgi:hypothetical protein
VVVPGDPPLVGAEDPRRWRHWDPGSAEEFRPRRCWYELPRQPRAQSHGQSWSCSHGNYGVHSQTEEWIVETRVGSRLRRLRQQRMRRLSNRRPPRLPQASCRNRTRV